MEQIAAYIWMCASFTCMIIFLAISYKTRKIFHLFTAIMWFSCAMWGMTVGAINIPWIRVLNTTIIPINAAVFGLIGGLMKLNEAINDRHI